MSVGGSEGMRLIQRLYIYVDLKDSRLTVTK